MHVSFESIQKDRIIKACMQNTLHYITLPLLALNVFKSLSVSTVLGALWIPTGSRKQNCNMQKSHGVRPQVAAMHSSIQPRIITVGMQNTPAAGALVG